MTSYNGNRPLRPEALNFYNERTKDGLSFADFVPFGRLETRSNVIGEQLSLEALSEICGYDKEAPTDAHCLLCPREELTILRFWLVIDQNGLPKKDRATGTNLVGGNFVARHTSPEKVEIFCGCGRPDDGRYDLPFEECSHLWLLRHMLQFDRNNDGGDRLTYMRKQGILKSLPCHSWQGANSRKLFLENLVAARHRAEKATEEEKRRRQAEILKKADERKQKVTEYARRQAALLFGTDEAKKALGIALEDETE